MLRNTFQPRGVIPACLMPFDDNLAIDESAYRRHLRDLAGVEGITAITINGHAAEVQALDFDEQQRALTIARDELGDTLPLVATVFTSNGHEAARLARMSATEGADGLLVFPSEVLALGGQCRPEMALAHFTTIANATDLPLILFQYPMAGGLGYQLETLLMLCEKIPSICAIKDWCNDPVLHERHIRELHALDRPVSVLSTHSAWLLGSLVMGCDGLLSGAGSVIANLHVALWRAVQHGDLKSAQAISDRIFPTVQAFYADPLVDMHNRMKEALVLLGRWETARVRPPLMKLPAAKSTGFEYCWKRPVCRRKTSIRRSATHPWRQRLSEARKKQRLWALSAWVRQTSVNVGPADKNPEPASRNLPLRHWSLHFSSHLFRLRPVDLVHPQIEWIAVG